MHRASQVNRQVHRLRTMRFVHTLSDILDCHHTGYALDKRLDPDDTTEGEVHKWGGRLRGASIPPEERKLLIAIYPCLHAVWCDPLWGVLMEGTSSEEWRRRFDSIVALDHPMRDFSNQSMNEWIDVPEPQRLEEMLLLLRTGGDGLYLQRLWMMRNLAAYVLVVSVFDPFFQMAVPLYRCIRDLPLGDAFASKELRKFLPIDPLRWRGRVEAAQYKVEDWQRSQGASTNNAARSWLWSQLLHK